MSKAGQKALEKFPILFGERTGYDKTNLQQERRNAFEKSYLQAEEDLELTNADVYDIWRIYNEVCTEGKIFGFDETSQEVLKRFKDLKKGKRYETLYFDFSK